MGTSCPCGLIRFTLPVYLDSRSEFLPGPLANSTTVFCKTHLDAISCMMCSAAPVRTAVRTLVIPHRHYCLLVCPFLTHKYVSGVGHFPESPGEPQGPIRRGQGAFWKSCMCDSNGRPHPHQGETHCPDVGSPGQHKCLIYDHILALSRGPENRRERVENKIEFTRLTCSLH